LIRPGGSTGSIAARPPRARTRAAVATILDAAESTRSPSAARSHATPGMTRQLSRYAANQRAPVTAGWRFYEDGMENRQAGTLDTSGGKDCLILCI
jgi:hypothetical protein